MIEQATLTRLEQSDDGSFGVLKLDGEVFCVTLEPPDKNNQSSISCIPPGEYVCRAVLSPGFGETYEICEVPGRTHILFHAGNVSRDTRGCVLLGRQYGALGSDRGVLRSGETFREFMQRCSDSESFRLVVEEGYEEDEWKISA